MSQGKIVSRRRHPPWLLWSLLLATTALALLFSLRLSLSVRVLDIVSADFLSALETFDDSSVTFLNRFAHHWWTCDTIFYLLDTSPLAMLPLLLAYWWAWFKKDENQTQNRQFLISGIGSLFVGVILARILAWVLPFRERPLRNPELHFVLPYHVHPERLLGWSSFPSDHGAMWFALATALLFVSRRASLALAGYSCAVLGTARVYSGTHYPTDLLAGESIGAGVALLAGYSSIRTAFARRPLLWFEAAPQFFYPCAFVITFMIAEGFVSPIDLIHLFRVVIKNILPNV